ncbi:hypothetical protein EDC04DRAFT_2614647 [Pisolithus marmoratus]|nr:hypothetical protein EDC04DRAFT_2614647 [Pisolithus marmoratus]
MPDSMVAFIIAKAYLPSVVACEQALLDALFFIPLPRDPLCDTYELVLSSCTAPFVMGLGHVISSSTTTTDKCKMTAIASCSDYVWDGRMMSTVRTIYDAASPDRMTITVNNVAADVGHTSTLGKHRISNNLLTSPISIPHIPHHIMHPSTHISHLLDDTGFEVENVGPSDDIDSAADNEICFFLP